MSEVTQASRAEKKSAERRRILEARLAWLEQNIKNLRRDSARTPYLALTAMLVVPAYFIWGPWFGALVLTGTLILPFAAWYIVRGHIEEYGVEHGYVSEELEKLNSGAPARDAPRPDAEPAGT